MIALLDPRSPMLAWPDVSPSPLNPIQRYMLKDDCREFPMTFVIRIQLCGEVQRSALKAAWEEALFKHPLARAVVIHDEHEPKFIPCEYGSSIDWGELNTPVYSEHGDYLDLTVETAVKLWARSGEGQTVLTLLFHHAPFDGVGAYLFIGDLLSAYANRTALTNSDAVTNESIRREITSERLAQIFPSHVNEERIKEIMASDFGGRVEPLFGPRGGMNDKAIRLPWYAVRRMPRRVYDALRSYTLSEGATLNDLMVAASFHSIHDWNASYYAWPKNRLIAVMAPADLRNAQDRELTATNLTTSWLLRKKPGEIAPGSGFLRQIVTDIHRLKMEGQYRFSDLVSALAKRPEWMEQWPTLDRCMATMGVSNIGDVMRRFQAAFPLRHGQAQIGDVALLGIDGVPPLRRSTRCMLSVLTYNRQLTLCFRCDPRWFTDEDVEKFADHYCQRLLQISGLQHCADYSALLS